MTTRIGLECKLYRNSGSYASPTWVEVENCKDVTINAEKGEADVSTRGSGAWRARVGTLKDGTVEFQMVHDPEDADYLAIQAAFFDDSDIEFAVCDGDIETSTTTGLRATFEVFNFSQSQPLEEGVMTSVTIKTTRAANPPDYDTVASGLFD